MNSSPILQAKALQKTYHEGTLTTEVIRGIDFSLMAQETVAIVGASGSGKSTLLHLLAGLDSPTQGEVLLNNSPFSSLSEAKRGRMRNEWMGFVYQFHFLLSELTTLENVMLPLKVRRVSDALAKQQAKALLERVGLNHRLNHKPTELSGGERQRVAIARALITQPLCVLADEPTGNLDAHSAQQVLDLMLTLNEELRTALLIVTHDMTLASKMQRQVIIQDGLIA